MDTATNRDRRNLKTVAEFVKDGPQTEGQIRWQIFNSSSNGLDEAGVIVRIGRRLYLDVDRYWQWVDSGKAVTPRAA